MKIEGTDSGDQQMINVLRQARDVRREFNGAQQSSGTTIPVPILPVSASDSDSPPSLRPAVLPVERQESAAENQAAGERLSLLQICRDENGCVLASKCMDTFEKHAQGSLDGWTQSASPFGRTNLEVGQVYVAQHGPSKPGSAYDTMMNAPPLAYTYEFTRSLTHKHCTQTHSFSLCVYCRTRWEMCLEDDGCGVVRAIGVRRTDSTTLSVFEAMAPGHASVLLKKSTSDASDVAATVLLTVVGPPLDHIAAATHLTWMKQRKEDRCRRSGSALGTTSVKSRAFAESVYFTTATLHPLLAHVQAAFWISGLA
eukprot:COSAG02_NODE_1048_length_14977_cov_26.690953_4_plen_312_part_00